MPRANSQFASSVFINCPFDEEYQPLLDAMVFTILLAGFHPRCAKEISDFSEVRLEKLYRLIASCKYSVHDISRTELDAINNLPRFNMPLELGIDLGCKRFGRGCLRRKVLLVLDRKRFRFQEFISDLAGQDPSAHENRPGILIRRIRDWLATNTEANRIPGGEHMHDRYRQFRRELPALKTRLRLDRVVNYREYVDIVSAWLAEIGE